MALYRRILLPSVVIIDGCPVDNTSSCDYGFNISWNATAPPSTISVPVDITDRNPHLSDVVVIAISVIAAVFFLSVTCCAYAVFRRCRIRRDPLLPRAAAAVPAGAAAGASPRSDDDGASEDGEWLHPVWYIRTVGLDESTIRSIAVAEYKAGGAILGAADCSVCLGEFQDGELVRLLPKCGHAFHVPCIDTWLRAHINCPLCRASIVDPAAGLVGAASRPPPATTTAATISVEGSSSSAPVDNPNAGIQPPESDRGVQAREEEDRGMEIGSGSGILINQLPESSELRVPSDSEEGGFQPVRRSFSMGSLFLGILPITMELEESSREEGKHPNFGEEQRLKNKRKQENSSKRSSLQKGHLEIERSLSSGRWFFSRYGRVARNSILPL